MNDSPVLRSSSMLAAQHRLAGAVHAAQRDAVGRLGRDHAGDDPARVRHQDVGEELRLHLAVGVEDVEQDRFDAAIADGGQVGADRVADALQPVARGAFLLEERLALHGVALELQRLLVAATTSCRRASSAPREQLAAPVRAPFRRGMLAAARCGPGPRRAGRTFPCSTASRKAAIQASAARTASPPPWSAASGLRPGQASSSSAGHVRLGRSGRAFPGRPPAPAAAGCDFSSSRTGRASRRTGPDASVRMAAARVRARRASRRPPILRASRSRSSRNARTFAVAPGAAAPAPPPAASLDQS